MSIEIMREVWKYAPVDQGSLLVLLALADNADETSRTCYPGVATLAKKSRLSTRQVQYCLRRIQAAGVIEVKRGASPVKTNLYRITEAADWGGCAKTAPPKNEPGGEVDCTSDVQFSTGGGETHCTSDVQPTSPEPSVTSVEPSVTSDDADASPPDGDLFQGSLPKTTKTAQPPIDRFDAFWDAYPKKAGKAEARKAWAKAVKHTDPQTIIDGAARYAAWLAETGKGFRPHAKHAQGWLNGERWLDHQTDAETQAETERDREEAEAYRRRQIALGGRPGHRPSRRKEWTIPKDVPPDDQHQPANDGRSIAELMADFERHVAGAGR